MSTILSIAASNAAQLEGNSGSKPFTFTVNRTGDLSGASSARWSVAGVGTNPAVASDFLDGLLPSGTVTFAAGDSQKIIYVHVSGDEVVEYDERFSVLLHSSTGATIGTSTAIGTIRSDDLPRISLSLNQATVSEDGSNNLVYLFSRTGPTATPLTINYIVRGTASSDDYASLPAGIIKSITIAANASSATLSIDPTADTLVEQDETVEISLSPTTFYTIATPAAAVGRIINDDTSLAISPPTISQQEGNNGKTFYTFNVTRTGLLTGSSTVKWSVAGIGAHPADANDFGGSFPTGTVTFDADETSKTITIEVSGDTIAENDETFAVILSDPTGATITTASAEGVIVNDDTNLAITPPCISQPEGNSGVTLYTFTVTRTGLLSGSSSVNWRVEGGIGDKLGANIFPADQDDISGLPYFGTIYFAAGETSKEITVGVNGDTIAEEDENFAVILSDAIGGTITEDTGIGVIVNDDTNLAIAPPIISQPEGNSGTTFYTFTVTRTGLLTGSSSARWSVAGIGVHPADADDFGGSFPTDTVTFDAGETSKTITIGVSGDTIAESDETFAVILSDPTGATITTVSAEGVIVNDDTNLGIIAINANQVEGNSGSKPFTFAIQRTGVISGTSTTSWAAAGSGITPADASDFAGGILPSGTVTFAPGEASKLISIDINSDTQIETDETFSVTLYDSSELTPLNPTSTGTIITDEPITISLALQPSTTAEDGGQIFSYTFTRNGPTDAPLTINFLILGSADPTNDYTLDCDLSSFPFGSITFNPGDSTAILEIKPTADTTIENDETIEIELLTSSEYAVGTVGPVVATIINNDQSQAALAISATDATKAEGNSGKTAYTFSVKRSGDTSSSSTAQWAVSSTQATGNDFIGGVLPSGTVSFATGDTSKTITVEVSGDSNIENDESFAITLSNPAGATIFSAYAYGSIINDDAQWTQLLGTGTYDSANALTTGTDGSIYIGGKTYGNLDGQISSGIGDAFISKFNPDGSKAWTQLLGTGTDDGAYALTTGSDGSIYIGGKTAGNLDGQTNRNGYDAFISKFNPDGSKAWTQLLGSGTHDGAAALTTGSDGSIYIGGSTLGNLDGQTNSGGYGDAFISKFNPDGSKAWTQLLGTGTDDGATALTTGSDGSIYIGGTTQGNLDGQTNSGGYADAFISKFNPDGSKAWTQLLGEVWPAALTTGSDGSIYIGGHTYGNFDGQISSGNADAFISKFNPDGSKAWTQLLGTGNDDLAGALTTGSDGSIYIGGHTYGNLDGQTNRGGYDAFIIKFNPDGDRPVLCLAVGTMIRTPSGSRPAEELRIGDLVLTPDGPLPLKFLGISTRHINNLKATGRMPVRITAGVFGENLPSADIYCTPSHAFALGDCLVEAQALINGQSIYQLEELSEFDQRHQCEQCSPLVEHKEIDSFTYYSLEFEQHVLVWANDLLTESYLPTYRDGELTRLAWNNYDNYLSLYRSSETMNELPMSRIPFARQLPLRVRERFKLGSSSATSGLDASREESCLTL
jgi:hypothetical protein